MEYQLFELLLLFAIYSIIGWIAAGAESVLKTGHFENRGICRGPGLISVGVGALVVLYGMNEIDGIPEEPAAFILGFAMGLVLKLTAMVCINGLCGAALVRLSWYEPVLCGIGAEIMTAHLNPLMMAWIRWASPWIHLIFLLIFYLKMTVDLPDGVYRLLQFRRKRKLEG